MAVKQRIAHKNKGLCITCVQPAVEGKSECQHHIDLHRRRSAKFKLTHKNKNTCIKCINKCCKQSKRYCYNHLRKHRTEMRRLRGGLRRIVRNNSWVVKCLNCSKKPVKGKRLCQNHIDLGKKHGVKFRAIHPGYRRARGLANKSKGICVYCTKPIAEGDAERCEVHIKYRSDWWMRKHGKAPWLRKPEVKARKKKAVITELKSSPIIKKKWDEVKDSIETHHELWEEKADKVLYNHMELSELEEFKEAGE